MEQSLIDYHDACFECAFIRPLYLITNPTNGNEELWCKKCIQELKEKNKMAEVIKDDVVVSLSTVEKQALIDLLDAQENLDPRLTDLNNSLQTV